MTLVARRSAPHALLRTGSGVLTLLIAACSGGDKKTDSTSTATSAAGTTATASTDNDQPSHASICVMEEIWLFATYARKVQ